MLIVQNETRVGLLTVPGQFNGLQCHGSNPISMLNSTTTVSISNSTLYTTWYTAYLRDEERECERQLTPLSAVCASLSVFPLYEDIAIARVSFGDY